MNLKTTLILLTALLAIGSAAWWLSRSDPGVPQPPEGNSDAQRPPLLPPEVINLKRLDRIVFHRRSVKHELLRTPTGWRMVTPVNHPVSAAAIQAFADQLGALTHDPQDASDRMKILHAADDSITLASGDTEVNIILEDELGGGYGWIVLSADSLVQHKTEAAIHHLIKNLDPLAFLSKRLGTPSGLTTTRLDIESAAGDVTIRKIEGRWYLGDQDTRERALSNIMTGFTNVPGYLNIPNAVDVVSYLSLDTANPAAYGLDQARILIRYTVETPGGHGETQTAELRVGSPADPEKKTYFVSYQAPDSERPIFAVMPWDYATVLARPVDDFRDPRVIETQPALVQAVAGEGLGGSFLIEFQVGEAAPEHAAITAALGGLAEARADDYLPADQLPGRAFASLTITPRIGGQAESLRVYELATPSDNGDRYVWVLRNNEAVAMRIPRQVIVDFFESGPP